MSYISWGNSINGIRVGVAWRDPASPSPAGGQTVTADIYIDRAVNITDTSNLLQWTGSKLVSGSVSNLNLSGVGQKLIHSVSASGAVGGNMDIAVTLNGVEYAPGNLNAGQSVWVPYAKPATPSSGSVARVSDSRADCSWSVSSTSAAPVSSQGVDRQRDDGAWATVASLGAGARSWSDTSLEPNRKYRFAVWVANSAGTSSSRDLGTIYTTPLAATAPTWKKTATGDVALSWLVRARWGSKQWVEESTDGGATWVKRSPDLSATAAGWTHPSPSTSVQHQYRIVTVVPSGLQAVSGASDPVVLIAPPNKPTPVGPVGVAALGEPILYTWRHNPADGTPQTAYELRHRPDSAASWTTTGLVTSPTSSYTQTVGIYTGGTPEWQVRTKGQHADWSDWSDLAVYGLSTRPVAGLTTPDSSGTWGSSEMLIEGTYHDAEGTPLQAWRIRLSADGQADQVWSGSSAPIAALVSSMPDGAAFTVTLDVQDANGLWSTPAIRAFTVTYAQPVVPTVSIVWDPDRATAAVQITNPDSGPAVVRNEVWSDGVLVGDTGPDGTLTLRLPNLDGSTTVVVRAISATPSSIDTAPIPVVPTGSDVGIHLNAGAGYALHAAMHRGSPSVTWDAAADVTLTTYWGDPLPSPTFGIQTPLTIRLAGTIWFDRPDADRESWLHVARSRSIVCYRDIARTRFGVLEGIQMSEAVGQKADLTTTFVETMSTGIERTDRSIVFVEDPPGSGELRALMADDSITIWDLLEV